MTRTLIHGNSESEVQRLIRKGNANFENNLPSVRLTRKENSTEDIHNEEVILVRKQKGCG